MPFFSSIVGLAKTLLIILLVYFGLKILARIFTPFLLRFVAKKAEQRFGEQFNAASQQKKQESRKEGETVIDKIPNRHKSSNEEVGEYIDYEEID
jgi:hypothetical protein